MTSLQTPPAPALTALSSMATRGLLTELMQTCQPLHGRAVTLQSVGGVLAVQRVQAGEHWDVVVLASDAIDTLIYSGAALPSSRVDLVHSTVALAVRDGAPLPDIGSEAALRQAVLAARSLACSTGPSGAHLLRLLDAWGITEQVQARMVHAPPGVPVGSLVADGRAEIGFQQLSELQGLPGITVLGPLPGAAHGVTTFAGAVCRTSNQPLAAAALLACLAAPAADAIKHRHGMQPARHPVPHRVPHRVPHP